MEDRTGKPWDRTPKPGAEKRLEALGEQLDGGQRKKSRIRADLIPIVGTRLVREWQAIEEIVTVTCDGFEWQARGGNDSLRNSAVLAFGIESRRHENP